METRSSSSFLLSNVYIFKYLDQKWNDRKVCSITYLNVFSDIRSVYPDGCTYDTTVKCGLFGRLAVIDANQKWSKYSTFVLFERCARLRHIPAPLSVSQVFEALQIRLWALRLLTLHSPNDFRWRFFWGRKLEKYFVRLTNVGNISLQKAKMLA